MKITPRILSIPPYVSTQWTNISSIHVKKKEDTPILVLTLNDNAQIEIPNMAQGEIDEIFQAHAHFSESERTLPQNPIDNSFSFSIPIKQDESAMLDPLGTQLQHNPQQANLPPLPQNVLEKIRSIIKAFGVEDSEVLDKAEENCNCIYCQLSRSLQGSTEEIIEDSDLQFRDWEVSSKGEKLYHIVNPLDKNEYYDVFLGDPIGCTCGSKSCEHIKAALSS
jgi:hypothetical protein